MSKTHQTSEPIDVTSPKKFKGGDDSKPKYKLTYFNYRWLAEPARLILSYVEEDFEDIRLTQEEWDKVKAEFPYGKIPLLEFEGKKLSQSFAIARFLGKKYNLAGADDFESAKCDEYADVVKDILKESEALWTDDDAKKLKAKNNILDKLAPAYYTQIEKDLKENGGKYLVGKNFTWADFLIAHFNEVFESFVDQTLLDNYPTIKLHQQNVFNVPQIKAWMAKRPVTEA